MKYIFIILSLSVLTCCKSKNDFKEYSPVFLIDNNLISIPDSLTEQHTRNIRYVFKYYDVDFKILDNKVLYKADINKELMWNYTLKANDTEWLKLH